jgi:DNA-binding transcriptional LysR family regulator
MRNDLGELSAFAIVAEERSFTRAAVRLGISQSALSHSMRGLEKRLGLQLLARTTRSVSPTAAGTTLLQDLAPALERIDQALAETRKQKENPAGRIRLIIPRTAAQMGLLPKIAQFTRTYPEIVLEVTSSNDPIDLIAGEYDAGVQLGEFIQRDMIAVRVTQEMRLAVVGSTQYFESHPIPRKPQDLKNHACIGFRFSNGLYRWEFEKGHKALTVSPQGSRVVRRPGLGHPSSIEWRRNRYSHGEDAQRSDHKGAPQTGLERLVPSVPGVFSLLSKPPKSACCLGGSD